ncbi:MAG: hypothetical protein IPJ13_03885 [Saprospiraceae bacterium]|nr:hypothetical protein [Saprospiraceae bacterium]
MSFLTKESKQNGAFRLDFYQVSFVFNMNLNYKKEILRVRKKNESYFFEDQGKKQEEHKEIDANDFSSELWPLCHNYDKSLGKAFQR